jgi:hypothetical protein
VEKHMNEGHEPGRLTVDEFLRLVRGILSLFGRHRAKKILFTGVTLADPIKFLPKGVTSMQMTDLEQTVAHVQAVDADGNAATLDSAPTWSSSDPTIVTVTPSPDGLTCVIGSPTPGPLGSAVVTVTAAVGSNTVSGTLAVDIIGSAAVSINVTTDTPTNA